MSVEDKEKKKTGVLLVNLGTPDNPGPAGVRAFLREMLSDRRIVDLPPLLWWPILHGIILRVRPKRSAHAYQQIWTPEGSPQLVFGRRLADAIRTTLNTPSSANAGEGWGGGSYVVALGMTYRKPSIPEAIESLLAAGAQRLVVLPLFPQYSGATTGAVFDQVSAELKRRYSIPDLTFISGYHAAPDYIEALRQSVLDHWRTHERPQHLLMSFHGLPKRNCDRGDPYRTQCERTSQLLADALSLKQSEWSLCFQSRFGAQEWLGPYTDARLKELPTQGIKRLGVICPGFSADCLETLEEIAIRGAETFKGHGGESLDYIPALNDGTNHAAVLSRLCR